MAPLAVGITAAAITASVGLVAVALCARPEWRGRAPLDQGARGAYRGWFEARSAHWLRPDVLYGVIVTPDRVLLANAGAALGPVDPRRERFAYDLGTATSPDALVARRPHGRAFPLAEIRRATFRKVSWWYRGAPPGPGLLVIERNGHPPLELMIDDDTQLSACVAALAPALGAAFDVPSALAREMRDPRIARAVAVLRQRAKLAILALVMPALFSGLVVGAAAWDARQQPRSVTGRVIGCFERPGGRSGPAMVLKLDVPPGRIECSREPFDVSSDLREVCAKKATVHAVYRAAPSGRLWVDSISVEGGSDILPASVRRERDAQEDRIAAGFLGACVAVAGTGAGALIRLRQRLRALGA